VVKLGADGALARTRIDGDARATVRAPALPVRVADAVGAGDAFCAGFMAATLRDDGLPEALRIANACGASVAATVGDLAGLPTRAELDRLLTGGGPDTLR
jgi:sugar/nucleoside kinase (ribokinase family)